MYQRANHFAQPSEAAYTKFHDTDYPLLHLHPDYSPQNGGLAGGHHYCTKPAQLGGFFYPYRDWFFIKEQHYDFC